MTARNPSGDRRRASPSASHWLEAEPLEAELHRIALLNIEDLRTFWPTRFPGSQPPPLPRDLLARMIAWRIQAERLGGLDAGTRKLLARLANGHREPVRRFRIGSVLVREYRGTSHEVTVVAGGFQWRGDIHTSLSTIARAITGTAWNGPRFFGLRDPANAGAASAVERPDERVPARREAPGSASSGQDTVARSRTTGQITRPLLHIEGQP
jgi:hypothetical protein